MTTNLKVPQAASIDQLSIAGSRPASCRLQCPFLRTLSTYPLYCGMYVPSSFRSTRVSEVFPTGSNSDVSGKGTYEGSSSVARGGGIIITVSNNISDALATHLLRRTKCSICNTAVGRFSKRSLARTRRVTSFLNVPRGIVSMQGVCRSMILSCFISSCGGNVAPGPYVVYSFGVGFNFFCSAIHTCFSYPCFTAKRCTQVACSNAHKGCRMRGTTSVTGSRSCVVCRLARSRLTRVLFPLNHVCGGSAHHVSRRGKLPACGGTRSRSVYFLADRGSCTRFLRGRTPRTFHPKGVVSAGKHVLKERGKLPFCAVNRQGKLKVTTQAPLCIISLRTKGGQIVINSGSSLFHSNLLTGRLSFASNAPPSRRFQYLTGVHCNVHIRSYAIALSSRNETIIGFSRPRQTVAPNRSIIFCRRSHLLNNNAVVGTLWVRLG